MGRFLLTLLFLLTFSFSSVGQCPVITESVQSFCESEGTGNYFHKPMISDLIVSDGGDGVVWYADPSSTEILSADHLLENGGIYYADNISGTCVDRPSVTVTILDAPNAGATTFVTLCSNDEPVDLLTLYNPSLLGPPDEGGVISPPLASGSTVFDPLVDDTGTYKYTVASNTTCPDDYSYITVKIEQAPDAGESAIVNVSDPESLIDLFAALGGTPDEGGSWSPILSGGGSVFDPTMDSMGVYTYTVPGSLYCDEAQATVTLASQSDPVSCPVIENQEQSFCESEGIGNYFHKPMISDLIVSDGGDGVVWYADPSSTEVLSADHLLEDGGVYYADNISGTCVDRPSVTVTILDAPNAGATTFVTLCSNDEPVDLLTLYNPSLLGPPDEGGVISPPLASGSTVFDPLLDDAGTYKYTVASNTTCPDDYSYITVNIEQAPDAGEDSLAEIPFNNIPVILFDYINGTPEAGGEWSPILVDGIFDPSENASGVYTYTVTAPLCSSSSQIEVRILEGMKSNNEKMIEICHKGQNLRINKNALQVHLKHGDSIGWCQESLVVYPNPSKDLFNFSSKTEIRQISIFSLNGILLDNFLINDKTYNYQLDLAKYKSGVYLAHITGKNGVTIKKIIKK
ncbi:MAG: T9SS type A sorting domain-containing protein [Bacteroidota bacterium]